MKDDRNAMELQNHKTRHNSAWAGHDRVYNGMQGPDVCGYFLFCLSPLSPSPPIPLLIFAVSASVSSERLASSCWSALSWQTLEVSQADTNIETSPHQTKLSRGEA